MGRTEFLTPTIRSEPGLEQRKPTNRAKWRSSPSAYRSVLENVLTPPTLLEMAIFRQLRRVSLLNPKLALFFLLARCIGLHPALEPALELTPTNIVVKRTKEPYRKRETEGCRLLIVGQAANNNVEKHEPDYDDKQREDQPIPS
jgi:hypothetical protein